MFILIVFDGTKYYRFNSSLKQLLSDEVVNLKTSTCEHKNVYKVLNQLDERYRNSLNSIKSNYDGKAHFIYQWIHKLKTPISVIELILEKCSSEEAITREIIKDIKDENQCLHNSIEQVLNIIRLEEFQKDYEINAIDLMESLRKVINERKNAFIYNKVFPVLNIAYDKVMVLSDSKWNQVILLQVITNAIKYSAHKELNKHIYFKITKDEKHTILSIKDEGCGISEYDLNRVFEPFFTGDNGRKYRDSTGIGLYTCKEVADKLGHEIFIKSIPHKGTEVSIKYLSKL
jgi:signal transduction histidine kinase